MGDFEKTPAKTSRRRSAWQAAGIAVGMFGFGFVMVPLYDVFCDITGLNGNTTGVKTATEAVQSVDESRLVKVQFLATLNQQMDWAFKPAQFEMQVHPGKVYTTHYVAKNLKPKSTVGQAVPSVMPAVASRHFSKTECFCFTKQVFDAGEQRDMPVSFMVSRELPDDISTLTLSYTFFDVTETALSGSGSDISLVNGG